jgi:hypothetical protein
MQRNDSLGQIYGLTGFQAYCSVNLRRLLCGQVVVSDAPSLVTPSTITGAVITLTAASFSIAFTPTPMPASTYLCLYASPQRSAGREYESDLRFISITAAAAVSPFVVLVPYSAKFGAPVVGNRINLSLISIRDGFASGPLITSAVVA